MIFSRDVKFVGEDNRKLTNLNDLTDLLTSTNDHGIEISQVPENETHLHEISVGNCREEIIEDTSVPEIQSSHEMTAETNQQNSTEVADAHNDSEEDGNMIQVRAPGRPRIIRTGSRGRPRKEYCKRTVPVNDVVNNEDVEIRANENNILAAVAEVTIKDALNGPNSHEWLDAMESEITSLIKNKTWDIVKVCDAKNLVGCRFVLTNKCDASGNIERRKARLVAKGYSQKYGIDYHQTFAPVARLDTLRLLLALSIHFGFKIWQFDVVTAYLHGNLHEKVLMKIPDGLSSMLERIINKQGQTSDIGAAAFDMLHNLREGGSACLLKKALYGLKQAGRQWYARLSEKLIKIGLKCTKNEPCFFFGKFDGDVIFVLVYVDDILMAAQNRRVVSKIQSGLLEDFELKDIGLAKYCLGLEIEQNNDEVKLKQTGYIKEILKRYGMYDCNPVQTPAEVNPRLEGATGQPYQGGNYRELIGALMYLCVATRPDISNVVSRLAQFVNNPLEGHWNCIKRVLRYLAGTAEIGLIFKRTSCPLLGYTDADWGGMYS